MKIGVIGGGQLGLLTILEGKKLGVDFAVLDKDPNAPASKIADAWYPPEKVKSFVASCDVLTYEFEHIDPRIVEAAEKSGKLLSGTLPLLLKQDKIEEKRFLKKKGYPVPDFWAAENGAEALRLAKELRRPLILKISRFGYDGKGQFVVKSEKDLKAVAAQVAPVKERFLIEELVPFEREVSCVGVADRKKAVRFFPVTQNDHVDGILLKNRTLDQPAPVLVKQVQRHLKGLVNDLDLVGLLAVEFFVGKKGEIWINEYAPRPHNTGHYTLDGAETSQFEALVRVLVDLPTGATGLLAPCGMVNILGLDMKELDLKKILSVEGARLYWYGKGETRRRRKMGHVNILGPTPPAVEKKMGQVLKILYGKSRAV